MFGGVLEFAKKWGLTKITFRDSTNEEIQCISGCINVAPFCVDSCAYCQYLKQTYAANCIKDVYDRGNESIISLYLKKENLKKLPYEEFCQNCRWG